MALALVGACLAACNDAAGVRPLPDDTLVRIAEDEAKSLDPQAVTDLASLRIAADQFEGLTRFNADGRPEAGLASGWTQSSDGLVWRFRLKDDLRFSDGVPIPPAIFADVLARLRDDATASPAKALFDPIDGIAVDGQTVIIRLREPTPALPELLAYPALAALPLHRPDWTQQRPLVTSGAYRLEAWALNDRMRLTANPHWQGPKPDFPTLVWRPVTDGVTAIRQVEAGAADVIGEFPSARLEDVRRRHSARLRVAPYRGSYYFAFNTRVPPFDDVRVRVALSMAVERTWLAGSMMATGVEPAWGIVPPGTTGLPAYRPDWSALPRSVRLHQAARLLRTAGYGPHRPLRFDIRFNSDTDHRRTAVALAAMWKPLGVDARLLNSEASLHFASLRRGDFQLARSGWIGDVSVPENFLGVHASAAGPVNYSGYANRTFDEALIAARKIPDPAMRAEAMRKAEAILLADAPIIPLYYYVSKTLLGKRIAGWRDNAANIHPSRTIRRAQP